MEKQAKVSDEYILYPYLFNLYTEHIIVKTGLDSEEGVKTGGGNTSNWKDMQMIPSY